MDFKDFDFRVWNKEKRLYINNLAFLPKFKISIGSCILAQDNGEWYSWDDTEKIEIELYTGFKDSCGEKIYEGDILQITNHRFEDSVQVAVFQQKGNFVTRVIKTYDEDEVFLGKEIPFCEQIDSISETGIYTLIVIGNIRDTKWNLTK